jgi:asparagine synthase (glutamine-hydrolysing)
MCGIVGSINFHLNTQAILDKMLHRGPDTQNGIQQNNVSLYHLRLSILDVTGGGQPMIHNDRYLIIFNGEIYNHLELRKQFSLQAKTNSDTETLLLLYEKMGISFLNYLDGMFAFCIYDKQTQKLIIARDRAGKKPLYFWSHKDKFLFASELNCMREILPNLEIETDNIYAYLRFGFMYKKATPYKKVEELQGGTYLIVDVNTLSKQQVVWWNIHDFYKQNKRDTFQEALQKVDSFLHLAVKRRLESSDLEVGTFLSGGIDSGLITAIASKYNPSLKSFTINFPGAYNEAPLAKLVATKYQTQHKEIAIDFTSLNNDIENIIYNYGEPFFDSSAIPSYYVSQAAKKHVTVILNGDGADELFGGYRRYVPFSKFDFFTSTNAIQKTASFFKLMIPIPNDKKSKINYLYRLLSLGSKSALNVYLSSTSDIFEEYEDQLLNTNSRFLDEPLKKFEEITNTSLSGLKKIMNLDFDLILQCCLLVKIDIATMTNSLEGRSPFLSKEILEYAPSMDDKYKINGRTTKYLLRELAKKYLPSELIHQPKRGFEIPLKEWVNDTLKEKIIDVLCASNTFHQQFVNLKFTKKLLENKVHISDEKRAKMIWALFCLEVWHKKNYSNA